MEHATPDVELAEAQLAVGRPDLVAAANGEPEAEADDGGVGLELEPEDAGDGGGDRFEPPVDGGDFDDGDGISGGGAELAAAPATVAAERPARGGNRLINFLKGSWRELQRVQWPDRRQVMQATGVVIGFVIVAGLFLGAADYVSQQLVNYILK
jgi:preprotein translocase subunit SecE